ncbi:acyl-CoA dehydrogenase family protein [Streptomyces sp. NPDC006140]|uniref:acyl-CoA dehydrogenase family protein n=1 Tax=Streptomyces sp. NPDC006140 TaxID=3154579 RepID=UPI0033C0313D
MSSLDVYLSEAHRSLRKQGREVAREEVAPRIADMEAAGTHTDHGIARIVGERGWFGVFIGTEHGGLHAGHVAKTILLDELSYVSGAAGAILQAPLIPTLALLYRGSVEQKQRWLPQIAAGTLYMAIAVTEPEHGSHVLGMTSTARRSGKYWIINADKCWVGASGIAHLHVVIVRTGKRGDPRGLSAFLVEADRDGLEVTQPPLVGLHGFTAGNVRLRNVRVPASALLGEVGDGLDIAYTASTVCGRPNLAAVALGLHRRVLDVTTDFLAGRPRYDGVLADLPVVGQHLAEMKSRLMTAEGAVYYAAHLLDQGVSCDAELVNSKLVNSRAAKASVQEGKDTHGGYSGRADYEISRLSRDIDLVSAPAGPDDIQLLRLSEVARGTDRVQWSARYLAQTASQTPPV